MSYFSRSKGEHDTKNRTSTASETRLDAATKGKAAHDVISTFGPGMVITGNVVCSGAVQVYGRITGDVHALRLMIGEGAHIEGKLIAQEITVEGVFKGTAHGDSVTLRSTAIVDGEIHSKSFVVEPNAQFEGLVRRLERAVETPTISQIKQEIPASGLATIVPITGGLGPNYGTLHRSGSGN